MQLSVCIITKNEKENLEKCITALLPQNFEIVVADTGSTDGTVSMLHELQQSMEKIKAYDFQWCDDFSAAKNFVISKAQNPYVMVIDSDEVLESVDCFALEKQIKEHPELVGRIQRRNQITKNGIKQEQKEWINRIFDRERFYYEGSIHEQVTAKDGGAYETYQAPVVIRHVGYDLSPEKKKEKAMRNISLLEQERERLKKMSADGAQTDIVNERMPYVLYQLGKSYYLAEDYEHACEFFAAGLSFDLNPRLEYVIDMVETYGYALLNSRQAETALFFENIYEEFGDSADFKFLMGLIYMNNARFEDAISEFKKATAYKECRNTGVNSFAAYYNIGVIYECTGEMEKARKFYQKCGAYEPARRRLQ
jgi:hypothetical protein